MACVLIMGFWLVGSFFFLEFSRILLLIVVRGDLGKEEELEFLDDFYIFSVTKKDEISEFHKFESWKESFVVIFGRESTKLIFIT